MRLILKLIVANSMALSPALAKNANTSKLPINAEPAAYGNGWKCKRGFKQIKSICNRVILPENAKLNYLGNNWECKRGYKIAQGSCQKVTLPENAKLNYQGNDWECKRGHKKTQGSCSKVSLPEHAKLTYLGNDWVCQKSFRRIGKKCVGFSVPQNAMLTYLGNNWDCNDGYKKSGQKCEELSKKELLAQLKRAKNMQARRLSSGSSNWQTIDKEIDSSAKWLIDGEIYEAKTYCFNLFEGDAVKFVDGSPGVCLSAKLMKQGSNEICEVWCE